MADDRGSAQRKEVEYQARDDFNQSINACYEAVRERVKNGGPAWEPKAPKLRRMIYLRRRAITSEHLRAFTSKP